MPSFIDIKGKKLVKDGQELFLRGVNLGNWMLIEWFMIGIPWVEYKMREEFPKALGQEAAAAFFDTFMDNFITEADIKFLKDSGFNLVRIPFNYRHFENDREPGKYLEAGFKLMDNALELCRKYGIYALLDMHAVPGCQARDFNAESARCEVYFWDHACFQERTAGIWRAIADRYKNDEIVFGYEIINEPVPSDNDIFHTVNMKLIRAIREADKNHIIVVESSPWGKEIDTLRPETFADGKVMPSLHHYVVQFPPFDRMPVYPGEYEGKVYGKKEMLATLDKAFDPKMELPMLLGEFGISWRFTNVEAHYTMLDHLLEFCDEHTLHWTLWSYKDVGMMGLVTPKETTPWQQFRSQPVIQSLFRGFQDRSKEFTEALGRDNPQIPVTSLEHFGRGVMRMWAEIALETMLHELKKYSPTELATMARSFAFENCEVWQKMYEVLRKHV